MGGWLTATGVVSVGAGMAMLLYVVALQNAWLPLADFSVPPPVAASVDLDPSILAHGPVGDAFDAEMVNRTTGADVAAPLTGPRPQGPEIEDGPLPPPGVASQISIPAIGLETFVVSGGVAPNAKTGAMEWQTLPFVAVHYASNTGLVGAKGNAVLAGHVVTLSMGNVFRDLYRTLPGDRVFVRTQDGGIFAYQVTKVRLADPSEVQVMSAAGDAEMTLITCAGTFNVRTQTFSKRLIVVAKLVGTTSA